ncbi:MAG TPA: hypothetical protein VJU61_27870, partial [Polyangiaceae bacterium]|nr:hypothetical protein [Polyangiaceae bacterium]
DHSLTLTATFARQTNNLIFVTSQGYPPNFGAGGFDAECNRLASAAGINNAAGNGFVAAVSGAESFWSRIPANARGWLRMDGLPFGDQRAQMLIDPPNVYHPARFDETGRTPPLFVIWTGTGANGDRGANCSNWTSTSAGQTGLAGHLHDLRGWSGWNTYTCDTFAELPIHCMGTTKTAPLVLPMFAGKRIWLTNTLYDVGSSTPDQKCQAERPAGVSSARALVAYAGRSAAEVLEPAAVYVRPDGQLVGTGAQLVSNDKPGVPWIAANGSRVYDYVWTGQPENRLPTVADTCSDWTNPSSTGMQGQSGYDNMLGFAIVVEPVACNSPGRLYCVEP